jgi:hypothetical protein
MRSCQCILNVVLAALVMVAVEANLDAGVGF